MPTLVWSTTPAWARRTPVQASSAVSARRVVIAGSSLLGEAQRLPHERSLECIAVPGQGERHAARELNGDLVSVHCIVTVGGVRLPPGFLHRHVDFAPRLEFDRHGALLIRGLVDPGEGGL